MKNQLYQFLKLKRKHKETEIGINIIKKMNPSDIHMILSLDRNALSTLSIAGIEQILSIEEIEKTLKQINDEELIENVHGL